MKVTEEVITFTEAALSQRFHTADVHRLLLRKYGIKSRTAQKCVARARQRILEKTLKSKSDHKIDALAFYDQILRNKEATVREKILAQERIDKLLGLESPARQDVQITQTDSFAIDDLGLPLEMRRQLLEAIRTKKLDQQGKVMELPAPAEPAAESAKDSTS